MLVYYLVLNRQKQIVLLEETFTFVATIHHTGLICSEFLWIFIRSLWLALIICWNTFCVHFYCISIFFIILNWFFFQKPVGWRGPPTAAARPLHKYLLMRHFVYTFFFKYLVIFLNWYFSKKPAGRRGPPPPTARPRVRRHHGQAPALRLAGHRAVEALSYG